MDWWCSRQMFNAFALVDNHFEYVMRHRNEPERAPNVVWWYVLLNEKQNLREREGEIVGRPCPMAQQHATQRRRRMQQQLKLHFFICWTCTPYIYSYLNVYQLCMCCVWQKVWTFLLRLRLLIQQNNTHNSKTYENCANWWLYRFCNGFRSWTVRFNSFIWVYKR